MTFLNAVLLAGAAAFAIPLLIHLLSRRKVNVVAWGAMHLLQEALRQRKRNLKVEQLLLLLARISIPILLALCLARPVVSFLRQLPGLNKTSLIVVWDNSYSMRAAGDAGSARERARQALRTVVQQLPRGSDVSIILAGAPARLLEAQSSTTLDLLMNKLDEEPGLGGPAALNDALQLAASESKRMGSAAREVLVVSDFQQRDWKAVAEGGTLPALEELRQSEPKPVITFYRVGNEQPENLTLVSVEPSALVVAQEQTVALRTRIQNHGQRAYQDIAVHLEADGARVRTTRVSIAAKAEATLTFTHAFDQPGDHAVTVRVEGDSLLEDNAFSLVIPVRDRVNCLLLAGEESAGGGALSGAADFLEIALAPHQSAVASLRDVIRTTVVDARQWQTKHLENMEAVMMANVERLPGNALNDLRKFVENGGGLLIFMGPGVDEKWYLQEFYKDGQGLLPCRPKGFGHVDTGLPPARILSQRYTHPATAYFNEARGMKLQDIAFTHWQKLDQIEGEARTILSLDRGDPLMVEKPLGKGRILLVAVPASPQWSNLPLQPVFVPLVQRLATYLTTQNSPPQYQLCGAPLRIVVPPDQAGEAFVLTDPGNRQHEIKPQQDGSGQAFLTYPGTAEPGIYELRPKTMLMPQPEDPKKAEKKKEPAPPTMTEQITKRLFAFNLDPVEADLAALPSAQVRDLAGRMQAGYAETQDEYASLDQDRRHGAELWQPVLLVLLGFLFVEVFLQQRIARA